MIVGVPKEIKTEEYRVAMTPVGVRELVAHGHEVLIQKDAGAGSFIDDEAYSSVGARIVPLAEDVFGGADMLVKVKEPQPNEIAMLEERHLLFTYLHLAAYPEEPRGLLESGATAIAWPPRPVLITWSAPTVDAACSSAGCPASRPAT